MMTLSAPDYISAPFASEWGSDAWIVDAQARIERARRELLDACSILFTEYDLGCSFSHARVVQAKADAVVRSKWLQREVVKAVYARREPFCVCGRPLSKCDGSRRGCAQRNTPDGAP